MTGLETILISAGGVSVATFGTFLTTARYYQSRIEAITTRMVTVDQCKKCQDEQDKDEGRREDAVEEVLRQIESLAGKYDRILKILILNVDIPNDVRVEILP